MVAGASLMEETLGRRRGQPLVAARAPLVSPSEGKRGNSPLRNSSDWVTGARASSVCALARWPGRPIRSRAAVARGGRCGAVRGGA
jgi:hypothetical protein